MSPRNSLTVVPPERARRVGRPSGYQPAFVHQARELCRLGATDADLARFFQVSSNAIWGWKSKFRDFAEACRVGKGLADDRVKRSLYQRAVGYEFEEEIVQIFKRNPNKDDPDQSESFTVRETVTKHVPADVKAADIWLKNRMPDEFHERFQHVHSGEITTRGPINEENIREVLAQGFLKLIDRFEGGEAKVIEGSLKEAK